MDEEEEDLFVPGSSYIKLLSLTPSYVLGGILYSVFEITLQIYSHHDYTDMGFFVVECHVKVQLENLIPNYRENIKAKVQRKTKAQPIFRKTVGQRS